jgi:gamma-butyrobetaine dioxygenase
MRIDSIDSRDGALVIRWADGLESRYPHLWLRDNDPSAFDDETQERIFDLLSVPGNISPDDVRLHDQGETIELTWPDRDEVSRFDAAWLRQYLPGGAWGQFGQIEQRPWGAELQAALPIYQAADLAADVTAMLHFLRGLQGVGFAIVSGLGKGENTGIDFARSLGPIRNSNFGASFDVKSKPAAINLAYTSHELPLHTDLPNQEIPPGFQFLHCLVNEAQGGDSLFCDGFKIAADLRIQDPEAFRILSDTPIPFRFHDGEVDIISHRPVFVVNDAGALDIVSFSPQLAATFDMAGDVLARYYPAYRTMMAMTRSADYVIRTRPRAGDMVIFDNRRILHGRTRFEPQSGARHLRGCYVDHHDLASKIRVLARRIQNRQ